MKYFKYYRPAGLTILSARCNAGAYNFKAFFILTVELTEKHKGLKFATREAKNIGEI